MVVVVMACVSHWLEMPSSIDHYLEISDIQWLLLPVVDSIYIYILKGDFSLTGYTRPHYYYYY